MQDLTVHDEECSADDVVRLLCVMLEAHATVEEYGLNQPIGVQAAHAYHVAADAVLALSGIDPRPVA